MANANDQIRLRTSLDYPERIDTRTGTGVYSTGVLKRGHVFRTVTNVDRVLYYSDGKVAMFPDQYRAYNVKGWPMDGGGVGNGQWIYQPGRDRDDRENMGGKVYPLEAVKEFVPPSFP